MLRSPLPSLLLGVSLWATATAPAHGQATGSVEGMVFDSLAGGPLADATVVLWNTPHQARTDSLGRFSLIEVEPGDYTLHFFHERLAQMGASSGPRAITVTPGGITEVELATPSMFTSVISQCLLEEHTPGTGALAGWVGDRDSGMGLPGASVTLSWAASGAGEPRRVRLMSDAMGWYRICDAPAGVPIVASARFMDRQGLRRELVVPPEGTAQAGFLLWPMRPSQVSGRLVDAETSGAITEAEVWLRGTTIRALTDAEGRFGFGDVPPGTYTMFARHIGYGTKQDTLIIPSDERVTVEMRVDTRAIEMAPLTVTVESKPLTERAMGGLTITRADIDKVRDRVRDAADILRAQHVPGIIVTRDANGNVCVGSGPGQVRMMFDSGCVPMIIFIDNVRVTDTRLALDIPTDAIERMVVYRPLEAGNLFGLGAGNGVLVIFTRNH